MLHNRHNRVITWACGLCFTVALFAASYAQQLGVGIGISAGTSLKLTSDPTEAAAAPFTLKVRNDAGSGIAVPYVVPSGAAANLRVAYDLIVKGTPTDSTGIGVSWIDVTDSTETRVSADDYESIRVGKFIGAQGYISLATGSGVGNAVRDLKLQHYGGNICFGKATTGCTANQSGFGSASTNFSVYGNSTIASGIGIVELGSIQTDADANNLGLLTFIAAANSPNYKEVARVLTVTRGATANQRGGAFIFQIQPNGTAGVTTAGEWDSTMLKVNTPVKTGGYTVSTLPSGVVGMRAYVTDQLAACAGIGAALTGGGAVVCPVYYNGSAWVSG